MGRQFVEFHGEACAPGAPGREICTTTDAKDRGARAVSTISSACGNAVRAIAAVKAAPVPRGPVFGMTVPGAQP